MPRRIALVALVLALNCPLQAAVPIGLSPPHALDLLVAYPPFRILPSFPWWVLSTEPLDCPYFMLCVIHTEEGSRGKCSSIAEKA